MDPVHDRGSMDPVQGGGPPDQHTLKRPRKCPGCKLLHAEHTFGDPSPYCTGLNNTHLSDEGNPPPDEENDLREQVKQLKLKQEALAKKSRIEKLKLQVAERQRCIEQFTKLQGTTTGDFFPSAEHLKAKKSAAVVDFPSTSTEHAGPKVGIIFYPPKPHRSRGTEIEFRIT